MRLTLHGYWRSSASYRTRIALNLKGIEHEQVSYDLRKGEQASNAFRELAPLGLVPALEIDGQPLTQSLAILEWLEERFPSPTLLPGDAMQRAIVRSMCSIIACDVHPLNNLRVIKALRESFNASEKMVQSWMSGWIRDGFAALEAMIRQHGGGYCYGNSPTIADCCLVPQVYNARRFGVDLSDFPEIAAVDARCGTNDAFARAAPENQPDADGPSA